MFLPWAPSLRYPHMHRVCLKEPGRTPAAFFPGGAGIEMTHGSGRETLMLACAHGSFCKARAAPARPWVLTLLWCPASVSLFCSKPLALLPLVRKSTPCW